MAKAWEKIMHYASDKMATICLANNTKRLKEILQYILTVPSTALDLWLCISSYHTATVVSNLIYYYLIYILSNQ